MHRCSLKLMVKDQIRYQCWSLFRYQIILIFTRQQCVTQRARRPTPCRTRHEMAPHQQKVVRKRRSSCAANGDTQNSAHHGVSLGEINSRTSFEQHLGGSHLRENCEINRADGGSFVQICGPSCKEGKTMISDRANFLVPPSSKRLVKINYQKFFTANGLQAMLAFTMVSIVA